MGRPASSGKCPIDHTALTTAAEPAESSLPGGTTDSAGRCPVDHETLARMGISFEDVMKEPQKYAHLMTPAASSGTTQSAGASEAGKCPVDHETLAAMQAQNGGAATQNGVPAPGEGAPKAVCPFGFGSVDADGNSSNKTSLHCSKCNALFYDAVTTSCSHQFCRACIQSASNCSKCGSGIQELTADTYLQDLVNMFISEHTSKSFLEQRQQQEDSEGKDKVVDVLRAEFFLQISLQSMRGGNLLAAQSRLEQCKEILVALPEEQRNSPEVCVHLGAVCGSQGDCALQLGDARQATHSYEASVSYLQSGDGQSSEVQQALTVSQNKLGDLWYRLGNLESARALYKDALDRRHALTRAQPDDVVAQIDYALSLAKVADIEQVMNQISDSETHFSEARSLASQLAENPELEDNKRLKPLLAYLNLQ